MTLAVIEAAARTSSSAPFSSASATLERPLTNYQCGPKSAPDAAVTNEVQALPQVGVVIETAATIRSLSISTDNSSTTPALSSGTSGTQSRRGLPQKASQAESSMRAHSSKEIHRIQRRIVVQLSTGKTTRRGTAANAWVTSHFTTMPATHVLLLVREGYRAPWSLSSYRLRLTLASLPTKKQVINLLLFAFAAQRQRLMRGKQPRDVQHVRRNES